MSFFKEASVNVPLIAPEELSEKTDDLFFITIFFSRTGGPNEKRECWSIVGSDKFFGKLFPSFAPVMTDADFYDRRVIRFLSREGSVTWSVTEDDGTNVIDNITDAFINEYNDRVDAQNNSIDEIVMGVYEMFGV